MKKKCYVLPVAVTYPAHHIKKGLQTGFIEKIKDKTKLHTVRLNYELWKKRIDEVNRGNAYISLRYWYAKPYRSPQVEFLTITRAGIQKLQRKPFLGQWWVDDQQCNLTTGQLAVNDGLTMLDFKAWFPKFPTEPMALIHFTNFRYSPNPLEPLKITQYG